MTLPFVSLGCHNLTAGSSRRRSLDLVRCALDLGITRFDVAPSYGLGTAERMLGEALGARRHDDPIEVTTKFGQLPDRHGAIKAWVREPYRWLRRRSASRIATPASLQVSAPRSHNSSSQVDSPPPAVALRQSLLQLRMDRVGALLTHEAVEPAKRQSVLDGLASLRNDGLVKRVGFSGELPHVQALLKDGHEVADIVQISLLHFDQIAPSKERRGFNLSRLAQHLWANPALMDTLADAAERRDFGVALSGALALSHTRYPAAIVLVNASSADRLTQVLKPLVERKLSAWCTAHESAFDRLLSTAGQPT